MIVNTEVILLSRLKYSDTSLIVKGYTKKFGLKTFIAKGVRAKKNAQQSLYQSFGILDVELYQKENSSISVLKSSNTVVPNTLVFDFAKSSIALFLSEVILRYIMEEEQNVDLYLFIRSRIVELINEEKVEEINKFTLDFLLGLILHIGLFPQKSAKYELVFCLEEGLFLEKKACRKPLSKDRNELFQKLLLGVENFEKRERRMLIKILLEYLDTQFSNLSKIKSLEVFEAISS